MVQSLFLALIPLFDKILVICCYLKFVRSFGAVGWLDLVFMICDDSTI